jgi:hypothetical protein
VEAEPVIATIAGKEKREKKLGGGGQQEEDDGGRREKWMQFESTSWYLFVSLCLQQNRPSVPQEVLQEDWHVLQFLLQGYFRYSGIDLLYWQVLKGSRMHSLFQRMSAIQVAVFLLFRVHSVRTRNKVLRLSLEPSPVPLRWEVGSIQSLRPFQSPRRRPSFPRTARPKF